MNQKKIAVMLFVSGIIIAGIVFGIKAKEDFYIDSYVEQEGSCYLDDGYCLHEDRDWTIFVIGWIVSAGMILMSIYLYFFDRSFEEFTKKQEELKKELDEAKKKDEFSAFLSGFSEDEQIVIKAIHTQEGIKQSTLRYRTGMAKTTLSLMLSSLEKRKVISKKPEGKTNRLYLIKKF